ncbi:MAG: hypothetical protein ACK41E_00225 [Deinococcales bacterium]
MKKIFFNLGLAALLSSCLDTGLVYVDAFSIRFTSEYRTAAGKSYICDNRDTNVFIQFDATERRPGALTRFKGTLFGRQTGDYTLPAGDILVSNTAQYQKSGDTYSYIVTIPAKSAPLNAPLKPQAVVVEPTPKPLPANPNVIGTARLELEVFDSAGGSAKGAFGDKIDVINNCN